MSENTRVQSMSKRMKIGTPQNAEVQKSNRICTQCILDLSPTFEILNKSEIEKIWRMFPKAEQRQKMQTCSFFCAGKSIRLSEVTCLASRSDKKGSTIYFLISSNYSRCLKKCTRQSELNVPSLKFYNQKTLIQIIDQTFQRRDFEGDDLDKK